MSVVTANGRKLSRSDQLCSEADEGVEFSESSIPGMLTTELELFCGLAFGRFSWVGVEWSCGLKSLGTRRLASGVRLWLS